MTRSLHEIRAAQDRVRASASNYFPNLIREAGLDPSRDLRLQDWSGVSFAGADLKGFDFSGAKLHGCNFNFAEIVGARFDKADLGDARPDADGAVAPILRRDDVSGWDTHCSHWTRSTDPVSDLYLPVHSVFRDAPFAPEMTVLPAGRFWMGSTGDEPDRRENEGPRHEVTIPSRFAIGRFAVTFEEYDFFCAATGAKKPGDEDRGRDRQPVVNVACEEAEAYCVWLSEQTGALYRLPSEAEWEFACRAGTETPYWTGETISTEQANFMSASETDDPGEYRRRTLPVGSFPANPWGLFDTHGNVLEWCADAWNKDYQGAPEDGLAWMNGDRAKAVLRGGSWGSYPWNLRSAYRYRFQRGSRGLSIGFRLARTLRE